MGLTATSKGGDFELPPIGVAVGRCYRVIDLGTQDTTFKGKPKRQHKVLLTWELLGEKRMNDGRPYSINSRYTMSTGTLSQLRRDLESWRGVPFTAEEIAAFKVAKVLGKYCLLNIVHEQNGEKTYANIAAIMPVPKGMPKPEGVNEDIIFDLDDRDMRIFEKFSDSLKTTIMASAEWAPTTHSKQNADGFNDDIPWPDKDESAPKEETHFEPPF